MYNIIYHNISMLPYVAPICPKWDMGCTHGKLSQDSAAGSRKPRHSTIASACEACQRK